MRDFTTGKAVLAAASAATLLGAGAAPAFAATNHRTKSEPVATAAASDNIIYHVYDAIPDKTLTGVSSENWIQHGKLASGNDVGSSNLTHNDRFELWSSDGHAQGTFYYNIGDPGSDGKSQYQFRIYGDNHTTGSNVGCEIDDTATGKSTGDSPYTCERKKQGGGDQDDSFVIEPKDAATHTISDNSQFNRQKMLDAWCDIEGDHQYSSCRAVDATDESMGYGQYRPSSVTVVNCTSKDSSQNLGYSNTTSQTDTLGVKLTVSGKLFDMLQTSLETSYQHAWTKSNTVSQTVNMTIAPGEYGWIDSAQKLLFVKGDYEVKVGNQTYNVDGVAFSAPSNDNSTTTYRLKTVKIPDGSTICDNDTPGTIDVSANAPRSSGIYRIAPAGASEHVMQAPDGNRGEAVLQLGQKKDNAYNQEWQFTERGDGYDTIESDDNPDLCLAADRSSGYPYVSQKQCNGGDAQRWSVTYEPSKKGFVLIPQSDTNFALGVYGGGTDNGSNLDLHNPVDTAQAWTFRQVN